jgi:dynein heavy chain 1
VGDVLLSAGFLTYIGFFDHYYRLDLRTTWTEALEDIHLKTTPTMSFVEYLSKPQNRIKWQEQALPNDELCMQNAIILDKFNRFPLIIDPSN